MYIMKMIFSIISIIIFVIMLLNCFKLKKLLKVNQHKSKIEIDNEVKSIIRKIKLWSTIFSINTILSIIIIFI